jgi:hypothetical protein
MRHLFWATCATLLVPASMSSQALLKVFPLSNASAITIEPGKVRRWDLSVSSSLPDCRLTGRVLGLAGGNKDVDVMVMTEDDYINWSNHESPELIFHSGQKTAVTLDVPISEQGNYVLLVSNGFSQYSAKTVQMQRVKLTCSQPQAAAAYDTGMVAANSVESQVLPELRIPISNEPAVDIAPGQYRYWTWTAKYPRNMCNVSGRVLGLAGGQKDVDVLIMTEDDFINWSNRHDAKVQFESGKKTAIPINVIIHGEGKYVFVVSNAFSGYAAKTVQMQDVAVTCDISPRE